jgi:hypothetical protein
MATRINSKIPYQSSGVYFTETDLTVVAQTTGGFSAAAVGLTERGPAFEIINSSTFEDRTQRLGGLNQDFPSSFYARQYLEQARNYKEVRILGLEGYKDVKGYAISLSLVGTTAAVPGTSPLTLVENSLRVVLKERPTSLTGRPAITSVLVQAATYTDPVTGLSTTAATDYLFNIVINYADSTTDTITCSLRPESKDYIVKKMWDVPFKRGAKGEKIFATIKNKVCPLWIDFIVPSTKTRPSIDKTYAYYMPGSTTAQNYLPLLTGNIVFGTTFTYQNAVITDIAPKTNTGVVVGTTVTATGNITGWWSGGGLKAVTITGVTGTGGITNAEGTWVISNVAYNNTDDETTFELYDYDDSVKAGVPTTPLDTIPLSATFTTSANTKVAKYFIPTWEAEVLDFLDITYQTPITPWFVSDGDMNGDFKRLFRFWSISDGEQANVEIKLEIKNINPAGNSGKGTFDLVIRDWSDREDVEVRTFETFSQLTLDPTSDNYVERRIGNGEDFPLRSKFIFIEMNKDEQLENDLLPYGVLGYPNIAGNTFSDVQWTTAYDQTKPLTKQGLGLPSNRINMFSDISESQLKFKNITSGTIGKGFHLNPNNNTTFATDQSATFNFANQTIYKDTSGNTVVNSEKVKRSRFIVDFFGGFDGWNVYNERDWGNSLSRDYAALQIALDKLGDKENIDADFTILCTPDFFLDSHSQAVETTLDMVRDRGDCLYIPDFSYDEESDPQTASDLLTGSNIRSNSTAVYFPWLQIENPIDKNNIWLPPSLLALGTITYVAQNENVWQPPGGAIRTVTNNLVRTRRRMKINDREILKAASVNPITLFPGSGYEITEVRTTQEVFSALSFIHNRLLLCYAKKVLNQTLRPLLFQLNGDLTKDAFISTVTPIFDRIKKLNGVEEYKVEVLEKPELNDRTTLYGRIIIVPLYPVERIVVDFQLQDSSVSFNA